MPRPFPTQEDEWRAYLTGTHPRVRSGRVLFRLLPFGPRCRQCNVPFHGPGGFLLRHIGSAFRPWDKNPNLCRRCLGHLSRQEVSGAEVDVSFLFADVRRSSELARQLGTMEFTRLMQRFYATATEVFLNHDARWTSSSATRPWGSSCRSWRDRSISGEPSRPRGTSSRRSGTGRLRDHGSRSGQGCTGERRSSGSCLEDRPTSSQRWVTRSTSRRTSPDRPVRARSW